MSRHTHANQRSQLQANRELRRAIGADRPKSFGIRRLVNEDINNSLIVTWDALQFAGDIPDAMEARLHTGVTLLPRRVLGKQLTQGLVLGHKLGHAQADFSHDQQLTGKTNEIEVKCGKVAMLHRRLVYMEVESDQLTAERERVFNILGSLGFKGAHKSLAKPLHITLGESESMISRVEERHVVHTVQENLIDMDTIQLKEWEIYPSVEQVTQVYPDDY